MNNEQSLRDMLLKYNEPYPRQFANGGGVDNYDAMIDSAYGALGRSGLGTSVSNIDQPGYDYWMGQLRSGAINPGDFQDTFRTAANAYMAQNPYNDYTRYVQGFLRSGGGSGGEDFNSIGQTSTRTNLDDENQIGPGTTGLTSTRTNLDDENQIGPGSFGQTSDANAAAAAAAAANAGIYGDTTGRGWSNELDENQVGQAMSTYGNLFDLSLSLEDALGPTGPAGFGLLGPETYDDAPTYSYDDDNAAAAAAAAEAEAAAAAEAEAEAEAAADSDDSSDDGSDDGSEDGGGIGGDDSGGPDGGDYAHGGSTNKGLMKLLRKYERGGLAKNDLISLYRKYARGGSV